MKYKVFCYKDGSISISGEWDEYIKIDRFIRKINNGLSHKIVNNKNQKLCKTQREAVDQLVQKLKDNKVQNISKTRRHGMFSYIEVSFKLIAA